MTSSSTSDTLIDSLFAIRDGILDVASIRLEQDVLRFYISKEKHELPPAQRRIIWIYSCPVCAYRIIITGVKSWSVEPQNEQQLISCEVERTERGLSIVGSNGFLKVEFLGQGAIEPVVSIEESATENRVRHFATCLFDFSW